MELTYKEDLFMILSMSMDKEEALKETERITNNFKKCYSSKPSNLQPIIGNDTYRYFLDELKEEPGWYGRIYYLHRVDKLVNNKWEVFIKFEDTTGRRKCVELINRLKLGGNTVIEY